MATFVNQNKSSDPVYTKQFRHGVMPILDDIDDKTFNEEFLDTGILIKDLTFDVVTQTWINTPKS